MPNREQNQREPTLEDRLNKIAFLNQTTKDIRSSKDPQERLQLYQNLAYALSENDETYRAVYGDIRVSPEEAIRYALQPLTREINEANSLYQQNRERITRQIIREINRDLRAVNNKYDAANLLVPYLNGLFEIPELDQATADRYAREEIAKKVGVNVNYSAHGRMEDYRDQHETIQLQKRIFAGQFIREVTNRQGNVTGIALNEDKIRDIMENIGFGATVYRNTQIRIAERERQAQQQRNQ
jgi:hypothetical protein